jgi:hypothetical protein
VIIVRPGSSGIGAALIHVSVTESEAELMNKHFYNQNVLMACTSASHRMEITASYHDGIITNGQIVKIWRKGVTYEFVPPHLVTSALSAGAAAAAEAAAKAEFAGRCALDLTLSPALAVPLAAVPGVLHRVPAGVPWDSGLLVTSTRRDEASPGHSTPSPSPLLAEAMRAYTPPSRAARSGCTEVD